LRILEIEKVGEGKLRGENWRREKEKQWKGEKIGTILKLKIN